MVFISLSLNKYPEHLLYSKTSRKKGGSRRDAVLPSKTLQSQGKAESNVMMSTQGVSVMLEKHQGCADPGKETRFSSREATPWRQEGEWCPLGDSGCKGPELSRLWFECCGCG